MSGGNTLFACDLMKRIGVSALLHAAMLRGCVMSGGSAGAICWFDSGHSDSMDPSFYRETAVAAEQAGKGSAHSASITDTDGPKTWKYIHVPALGFLPGLVCPHFDRTQSNGTPRCVDFESMLTGHAGEVGIGIDHFAALAVRGNDFSVIRTCLRQHCTRHCYELTANMSTNARRSTRQKGLRVGCRYHHAQPGRNPWRLAVGGCRRQDQSEVVARERSSRRRAQASPLKA